jgi:hypothetical protein
MLLYTTFIYFENMHIYTKIVIIVVLALLTLSALMMNAQIYVPANEADVFTKNFPYNESFATIKEMDKSVNYGTYGNNSTNDSLTKYNITPNNSGQCYKVGGVSGLACSPDANPENPKDIYSEAKGSPECHSYGLMNSKGYLCLNEEQKKLYTTRGGNAYGGPGDIGLHSN